MGEDSSIARHLRAGQDRVARVGEAVAAFRRLAPEDYGYFLATIETDLGGGAALVGGGGSPRLLAASSAAESSPPEAAPGTLREAVLGLLSDGRARSTIEIRRELEAARPVKPATLNTEIFTLRKNGLLRSEGQGRGRRHTIAAPAAAASRQPSSGKREPAPRAARKKRDDDEDHPAPPSTPETRRCDRHGQGGADEPARGRTPSASAEQIYAAAISGHHLLSAAEELELARRLEAAEIAIWKRLITGPLEFEARTHLRALEPPVEAADGETARTADLDRLVASRVIELLDQRLTDRNAAPGDIELLETERAALRSLEGEADRIRERFATCNLRLVPSTIRRHGYQNAAGLSMGDLIQEGNLGLLKAIPRFDYRRGLRFSTFATWWIRHYLVRARQNLGAEVRVPVHLHDLASKVRRATRQLRLKLGRDPSRTEIARALKISAKSIATLESAWLKHRESLPSFDSVGDGEGGETPSYLASDAIPADEVLGRLQEDGQIADAIAGLPPLLAQILRRHYGLDGAEHQTFAEIGASMQLSRERIRQLEVKALGLLREKLDEKAKRAA